MDTTGVHRHVISKEAGGHRDRYHEERTHPGRECATEVAKGMLAMETGPCCFAVSAVSRVTSKNQVLDKYLFNK